jgi:hypothetical protein
MSKAEIAEVREVAVAPSEVAASAKSDFNFLAMLAMPGEFQFAFPAFFITLFYMLTVLTGKIQRFAIGIPRGFAKTTYIKLLCVWYILFSDKHFILIVSASEKKAIAIIADICDMLSTPNIRRIFGHWDANKEVDQSVQKVFHYRGREIILWAAGAGSSVRGINRKNKRPDVMIMDDIQEREDAENKDLADALTVWMLSTLMKARSPFGCTYIFIGNMYPRNSILEKLKNNSEWTTFIVGGILADGTSLWEELKPIEELLSEYESDKQMGHPEVFVSEVLNSTEIALSSGIDPGAIPHLPDWMVDAEDQGEGGFIIIDPSSGKIHGDDCTIEHFDVRDGSAILDEIEGGLFSPLDTIKAAITMGFRRNTRAIFVEATAYQSTLLFWFEKYCTTAELNGIGVITGFQFFELMPNGRNKANRIKKGYTQLLTNSDGRVEIYLHPKVRSLVINQYMEWNPVKMTNTDDIIDGIGYVDEVLREHDTDIIRNIFDMQTQSPGRAAHGEEIEMPF